MLLPSMVKQGQVLVIVMAGIVISLSLVMAGTVVADATDPCEQTGKDSFLKEGCRKHNSKNYDEVKIVDDRQSLQAVSAYAGAGTLILGDPRKGVISAAGIIGRNRQMLAGLESNGEKPVLRYASETGSAFMLGAAAEFALTGFELDGSVTNAANPLLLAFNPGRVHIFNNRLISGNNRNSEGVRWSGDCQAGEGNVMVGNEFDIGANGNAVTVKCQSGNGRDLVSIGNVYRLPGKSVGLNVRSGSVESIGDRFESSGRMRNRATAMRLYQNQQSYPSRIQSAVFNGEGSQRMVGIDLRQKNNGSPGGQVQISGNTFSHVWQGIRFSGHEDILPDSVCNIWQEEKSTGQPERQRCLGFPKSGFVHFTDGVICTDEWGTGIDVDDIECESTLSRRGADSDRPLTESELARLQRRSIVSLGGFSSTQSQENENNEGSTGDSLLNVGLPAGLLVYIGIGIGSRVGYAVSTSDRNKNLWMVMSWIFSGGICFGYDILQVLYRAYDLERPYLYPHNIILALYEGLFYGFPEAKNFEEFAENQAPANTPALSPSTSVERISGLNIQE